MFTYCGPIERPLFRRRLHDGRGLEFPSVTQPVATDRTVAYRVGADIFVYCLTILVYKKIRRCAKGIVRSLAKVNTYIEYS